MGVQIAQNDIRRVFALAVSFERHALHIVNINFLGAADLVETDINRATLVSGEVNGVLFPLAFPKLMRRIAFLGRGIIGVDGFKRTGIGTAERHLDTQFARKSVVANDRRELEVLSVRGFELRGDEPTLRAIYLADHRAVMTGFNGFLPSVAGVAVDRSPSFGRETLALKAFIELLCIEPCA